MAQFSEFEPSEIESVTSAEDLAIQYIMHYSEESDFNFTNDNKLDENTELYDKADSIVYRKAQSHPQLGFGAPDVEEVRNILEETIVESDDLNESLEGVGIPESRVEDAKQDIYDALNLGLAGEVRGPISAPYKEMRQFNEAYLD